MAASRGISCSYKGAALLLTMRTVRPRVRVARVLLPRQDRRVLQEGARRGDLGRESALPRSGAARVRLPGA